MKKLLLLGAASLLITTSANALPISGTLNDNDGSSHHVTYSGNSSDDQFEDAAPTLVAQFSLHGSVTKTCAISGVDDFGGGLQGNVDLGTIGITAGDDQALNTLFTMTGPTNVTLHSDAAGCNYRNNLKVAKDSALGLVNATPGSYDSNQFQANIPYAATAAFTGVADGAGAVAGTAQNVTVNSASLAADSNFGAWRSPLDISVTLPAVTSKGLVGGTYAGTLTVTLAII